ncbi:hypothetical protein Tco_0308249 [Tanacetum coccineum]
MERMTLNSKELKKRTKGINEEADDGLYVRGRSDQFNASSEAKTVKEESKWCFGQEVVRVYHDSCSSDNEGNAYFGEALVVVGNDEMTELVNGFWLMVRSSSISTLERGSSCMTFKVVDGDSFSNDDAASGSKTIVEDRQLEDKTNRICSAINGA